MNFLVVTLAPVLLKEDGQLYSYAPYVKEMNIWFSKMESITIVAPTFYKKELLVAPFYRNDIKVVSIPNISMQSAVSIIKTTFYLPIIMLKIAIEMNKADHIHLRCPGNIGLLGSLLQIFFPRKPKTAKYAGNWDPKSKQPISYRFQKWLLSNTFLTKNMRVLVYGKWPKQSSNIYPFFTATYSKNKIKGFLEKRFKAPFTFMFVGSLTSGKRPLYAVQLVEALHTLGENVRLEIFGDGEQRESLTNYIKQNALEDIVLFHGNASSEEVEAAYKKSHFLVLPSKSEGWPKVVAEAMFWGVLPMVTKISCVPWMLDNGHRGILSNTILEEDIQTMRLLLQDEDLLKKMSKQAQEWSHQYTLEYFEAEIERMLA
ncbi:MAG: glycosyltransferase [Flavobacteriaceae bacterium]